MINPWTPRRIHPEELFRVCFWAENTEIIRNIGWFPLKGNMILQKTNMSTEILWLEDAFPIEIVAF